MLQGRDYGWLFTVAGGEDCLWYVDKNGSWHPGFDCEFFTFCCGTCQQRYCCRDPLRLLTERQQRHCLAFRCHSQGWWGWGLPWVGWVLGLGATMHWAVVQWCWALVLGAGQWYLGPQVGIGHWVLVLGTGHHWVLA